MPVNAKNPQYVTNLARWQRYRDVIGGEDEVKDSGTIHLPKLTEQSNDEYLAYKARAVFFNATGRTVDSFVGMIFRKPPDVEFPAELKPASEDITLQGESLHDYLKSITREVIGIGRAGSLIDWSVEESRAYVSFYPAEQIINWRVQRVRGKSAVTMIVLSERVEISEALKVAGGGETADQTTAYPEKTALVPGVTDTFGYTGGTAQTIKPQSDEFSPDLIDQIRVLKLVPGAAENADWVYQVEIWQEKKEGKGRKKTSTFVKVSSIVPQRKGKTIPEIPFVFHGPNNLNCSVDKSPVADIASLNLSHYRTSADLEHGRHYTGLPTPYVFGIPSKTVIKIGAGTSIVSEDHDAKAGYLEFKGEGLKALETAADQKEHQMAVLGARMLEVPKRAAETVEVLQMKQTGEQASLSQIALTVSRGVTSLLRWCYWWSAAADTKFADTDGKVKVALNDEFNPTDINPQLALAIVALVQAGLMSPESAVYTLKKGELGDPALTVDDELALIETAQKLLGDKMDLNDPTKGKGNPPKPKGAGK